MYSLVYKKKDIFLARMNMGMDSSFPSKISFDYGKI